MGRSGGLGKILEEARAIAARTASDAYREELQGEAAKIAFFSAVSLFPIIMVLFALTGMLGGDAAFVWIMQQLRATMPGEAADAVEELVGEITGEARPGILSVGVVVTLWAASWGLHALSMALERASGAGARRRWLTHRLFAVGMLAGILLLLIAGTLVLISGPEALRWLGLQDLWFVLRWPAVFGLIVLVLWLIYYLSPQREERPGKGPVLLGAVTATTLWLAATAGFRLYVATFGAIGRTYGLVAGILILLIWLYLTALSLLIGAKVAAVTDQRRRARHPGASEAEKAVAVPPSPS